VEVQAFIWSGRNSQYDRRKASIDLARYLNNPAFIKYRSIHIIGHSHGGNIATRAGILGPNRATSVITVGTPFISATERNISMLDRVTLLPTTLLTGLVLVLIH